MHKLLLSKRLRLATARRKSSVGKARRAGMRHESHESSRADALKLRHKSPKSPNIQGMRHKKQVQVRKKQRHTTGRRRGSPDGITSASRPKKRTGGGAEAGQRIGKVEKFSGTGTVFCKLSFSHMSHMQCQEKRVARSNMGADCA